MLLDEYYFDDPRVVLIPIEHLTPCGLQQACATLLQNRAGWTSQRIELFNQAFALYWQRSSRLAARLPSWPAPRLRHVAIVTQPDAVRPYVQLLNTSSWLLYDVDFDPTQSNAEFTAYLFVHGDRMAVTGEVTMAALYNAPYWFDRTDEQCAAFAAAAATSTRADAVAFRALARATTWLRQLSHETLRPPSLTTGYRPIPHTGLVVRRDLEALPAALVAEWTSVATGILDAFHTKWQTPDHRAVAKVCEWLRASVPPLLVCARHGRILWEPEHPERLGTLRGELRSVSGAAARDLFLDLQVVDARTRAFHAAVVSPEALPPPDPRTEQSGYVYLHRERRQIAYNLDEPSIDRRTGPTLPYARAMLGARTIHEWAHLAADAGWIPQTATAERVAELMDALADALAATVAAAPSAVRARTRSDLDALIRSGPTVAGASRHASAGQALARLFVMRMADYQSNLLAQRFMTLAERETYVRHNVRTLRREYGPEQLWRMLVRYLYEYNYLGFSAVEDRRTFFLGSTWFDADFLASGILAESSFDRLVHAAGDLCDTYVVDESRFRPVSVPTMP